MSEADRLAEQARQELLLGRRHSARRLAFAALAADGGCVRAWLVLAGMTDGVGRSAYLRHVLSLDPNEPHAKRALTELMGERARTVTAREVSASAGPRPRSGASTAAEMDGRPAEQPSGLVRVFRRGASHLALMLLTLIAVAYLTSFGLIMADRGRRGLPAAPLNAAGQALVSTTQYLLQHPSTYVWSKVEQPAFELVATAFSRSAGLLGSSLIIATALGLPLGVLAASRRGRFGASLVRSLSLLGMSVPSFLLGMLLWIADIWFYRQTGIKGLPTTGFGWDGHIVLPALVLAARPLAQITQVTYVTLDGILDRDFMRTALGKGLPWRTALWRHALSNVWNPVLTTLTTSLRLSLASLPVVEAFFLWPGLGLVLLQAIDLGMSALVMDLIVALGFLFLLLGLVLDFIYPLLDPRLRQDSQSEDRTDRTGWREQFAELIDMVTSWAHGLRWPRRKPAPSPPMASDLPASRASDAPAAGGRNRRLIMAMLTNPAFVAGTVILVGFLILAVYGDRLTANNAYQTHGALVINGEIGAPPFPPSSRFPWGTDPVGRDLQALVLSGARRTLSLAMIATAARVLLGSLLGLAAGWWRGSWMDRLLSAAIGVWAAFPVTLFAMILILALGIKQGVGVFVIALCVVGWGEIAQLVRSLVISLKNLPFVEAARSLGSRADQIILHEILPNLAGPLLVAAALEAAGVLMLLAELGFLNIFVGGGFIAELMEISKGRSLTYSFSDVPEWSALLASIRTWWRGSPWLGWYPGVAFFVAILAFNLWGDGLRRLLEEARLNLGRLINRYSVGIVGIGAFGLALVLNSISPMTTYRSMARQFNTSSTMADIQALASPEAGGRETGTPGAALAAAYIAERMRAIGLQPAGENNTFIQTLLRPRFHLAGVPKLEVMGPDASIAEAFVYRQDFAEHVGGYPRSLDMSGPVVGCVTGPYPGTGGPQPPDTDGKIVIVLEGHNCPLNPRGTSVALVVPQDPMRISRRYLYPTSSFTPNAIFAPVTTGPTLGSVPPALYISRQTADLLLQTAGSSLIGLESLQASAPYARWGLTAAGATVHIQIDGLSDEEWPDNRYMNVIGYIPGKSAIATTGGGPALDSLVVMVGAYYDGNGVGPDGSLYPGANDNASGVAMLLELAREMKASPYEPKKTVVFVAWSGGERDEGLSVTEVMNAMTGFNNLTVESVIELSGVGGGTGDAVALGQGSSYRLIQLFQEAAGSIGGVATTTRGRGPHFGLPMVMGFGSRSATSLYLSWDGSDATAHLPTDKPEAIEPEKLRKTGESTLLTLLMLSREVDY